MLQSMRYWVDEYHIDGFRVDLMGVHDIETMNRIRRMFDLTFPATFIYGEVGVQGRAPIRWKSLP